MDVDLWQYRKERDDWFAEIRWNPKTGTFTIVVGSPAGWNTVIVPKSAMLDLYERLRGALIAETENGN